MSRIPWGPAGFALGLASLFISLGGPAWAAKLIDGASLKPGSVGTSKLKRDAVTTSKIKAGGVTGSDIRNRAITDLDLSASLLARFTPKDGSITSGKLADGAVTTPKLAPNAIDGSKIQNDAVENDEVRDGSLTADDLGPNSVGGSELQAGVVDRSKLGRNAVGGPVLDGSGTVSLNFPSIAANRCNFLGGAVPNDVNLSDDVILASPNPAFGFEVTYSVEIESSQTFAIKVCNPRTSAQDPDATAGSIWNWVAIDR